MASPVTFCAVHRPLIRPSMFRRLGLDQVYCSSELALSQPAAPQCPVRHQAEQRNGENDPPWSPASARPAAPSGPAGRWSTPQRRTERNSGVQQAMSGRHLPATGQRRIEHPHRAGHGQQTAKQRNPPISGLRQRKVSPASRERSGCSRGCGGGGSCGRRSRVKVVIRSPPPPKFHATPPVASSRPPIIGEITEPRRTVNMVMARPASGFPPTSAGVAASSAVTPARRRTHPRSQQVIAASDGSGNRAFRHRPTKPAAGAARQQDQAFTFIAVSQHAPTIRPTNIDAPVSVTDSRPAGSNGSSSGSAPGWPRPAGQATE